MTQRTVGDADTVASEAPDTDRSHTLVLPTNVKRKIDDTNMV